MQLLKHAGRNSLKWGSAATEVSCCPTDFRLLLYFFFWCCNSPARKFLSRGGCDVRFVKRRSNNTSEVSSVARLIESKGPRYRGPCTAAELPPKARWLLRNGVYAIAHAYSWASGR